MVQARGQVTDDPLKVADAGYSLQIERVPFPPAYIADGNLDWTMFNGVVLQLLFGNPKSSRITGSAVMVAPGVALAARHVIEPELPSLLATGSADRQGLMAVAITAAGIDIWRVHQVYLRAGHDLALLTLDRASTFENPPTIRQSILSTRIPSVGEMVSISGFVAENIDFTIADGCKGRIHASQGLVVEQYPRGRDRCMMPGPCFSVSVGTPGGLSGGPAFDETGRVVGILSTSIGDGADDVSFVSLLTPIIPVLFEPHWLLKHLVKESACLLELDARLCEIEGRDKVRSIDRASETFEYEPWS